jgi:superfamily II DNA or RNA helicase
MANSGAVRSSWFDAKALQDHVDYQTWLRGQSLFLHGKVLSFDVQPDGVSWVISGEVQGTLVDPYEVQAEITLDPQNRLVDWFGTCSCPVGEGCKHAVALTIKAGFNGLRVGDKVIPATLAAEDDAQLRAITDSLLQAAKERLQQQALASAEAMAERQLLGWLHKVDATRTDASSPPVDARSGNPRVDRFLYLVSSTSAPGGSRLQMTLTSAYTKVQGGWSKPSVVRYEPSPGYALYDQASATDRQILHLMRACKGVRGGYAYGYGFADTVWPSGEAGLILLRQAASTGRLFTRTSNGLADRALRWGEPEPLQWRWVEVEALRGAQPGWRLQGALAREDLLLCVNEPPLYLDAERGWVGAVVAEGVAPERLAALLEAPVLSTSALQKHAEQMVLQLGAVPLPPVVPHVESLVGVVPVPCLHLSPVPAQDAQAHGLVRGQLRFNYAGRQGYWRHPQATVMLPASGADPRQLLHRDLATEQQALERLHALGLQVGNDGLLDLLPTASQLIWLRWADSGWAELRDAGFELVLDEGLTDWVLRADDLQVRIDAQGGESDDDSVSPWFDLSLGIEINGERHNVLPWLPELLAAVASAPLNAETGQPELPEFLYVRAANQQGFVRLPSAPLRPWLGALFELVGDRTVDFGAEKIQLSRLEALRAGAALGEGVAWAGAQSLRGLVQRMRGQQSLPPVPLPDSVRASLRPYQQQGLNWLQFLRENALAGILADDMGLGKTLQTLAHIQVEKDAGRLDRPALIIAPVSLLGNWQREAERFCPDLRCLVLHGQERHAKVADLQDADVVIAPYSLLQRDRELWLQTPWHLVALDEAQNIKNASTHAAQVACELVTRHRLCLSGTPMENHLGEIWSLFHFLMPGFLGAQQRFKEQFRNPIERQGNTERLAQLRARITPFMLRRTKALVAHELPPKVETVARVELTGKQADLYETIRLSMEKTVREALDTKGLAKSQITILDALLKLRQVCCDPQLLKLEAAKKVQQSAKLEHLMEVLPEMLAEGRRVLLFSQFTSMLTLIEAELKKRDLKWVKLTGQSQKRDEIIERFTSGQVPLFLISLKAGGVGLNLPQADTVIHYDPWWNPAVENQATDRAHRIGQTQSVWVIKLVAQGTIEERILALQERKAALANDVYSGATARREPMFGESDLAELLKPLGAN